MTLYSDGQPIAHSRVSTGTPSHPTPTGVFSVIQKDRWHRSNLYDDAPMFYMQRITWSGVAMHQGIVPNHPASHGCIRLPEAFAKQLWGVTRLGVRVIVTRGEVTPAPISNARLFTLKREPIEPRRQVDSKEPGHHFGGAREGRVRRVGSRPLAGAKRERRATSRPSPATPRSTRSPMRSESA